MYVENNHIEWEHQRSYHYSRRLKIHKHQLSKIEKKGVTQNIETILEQANEMKSRSRHAYSIRHIVISQGKANRGVKHQTASANNRNI